MQRYKLNMKGGSYTEGDAYAIQPVYRQQVVPGQTINIAAEVSIKTSAFTKNISTPALASTWFFYVPHRLVWTDWMDFISKEKSAPTFPTTANRAGRFFDDNAGVDVSSLYRRAYKLCYNEYFGTETIADAWYTDLESDTTIGLLGGRNPEQFASKIINNDEVVDPEFSVSGSAIPLNDFYRQLMNARSQQRSQMTGNKYVDTLARMGVDASWMITDRPEFLGTSSRLVGPQLTAITSSTETGFEVARFQAKLSVNITRKQFAEHGYIVGVAAMRPLLMWKNRAAQDAYATGDWIDSFYSADNTLTKDTVNKELNGVTAGDEASTQRFGYLKNGTWLIGEGNQWTLNPEATAIDDLVYPMGKVSLPISDELGTNEVAYTTSVKCTGMIPVGNHVA